MRSTYDRPPGERSDPSHTTLDIDLPEVYKQNRARFERPAQSAPSESSHSETFGRWCVHIELWPIARPKLYPKNPDVERSGRREDIAASLVRPE
jgi:hypothetical protein